jgi:UDP-N-acetyl-2-amino-2-deoxyglucuronate dehydrogenase
LLWIFGDVARVRACARTAWHAIEVEDTAVAILEFVDGPLDSEATTAAYPGYPRRLEVAGSRGTLITENDQTVAADLRTPRPDIALRFAGTDPSTASPVVSDIGGHQAVFEDFIGALEQDCTPACDRKQGRRSVELIEAIYRATQNSAMISGSGAGRRPVTRFEEKKLLDEVFDDHNPAGRVFPSGNVRSCARKLGDACRGPGRVAVGYVCL